MQQRPNHLCLLFAWYAARSLFSGVTVSGTGTYIRLSGIPIERNMYWGQTLVGTKYVVCHLSVFASILHSVDMLKLALYYNTTPTLLQ
eukprot:scaffold4110_cov77-Skeletonema_dohrnii-CCMP3373.AAC.17